MGMNRIQKYEYKNIIVFLILATNLLYYLRQITLVFSPLLYNAICLDCNCLMGIVPFTGKTALMGCFAQSEHQEALLSLGEVLG